MRRKKRESQIYPDEIFMDSKNIPDFDTGRFEGRVEKPIGRKTFTGVAIFFAAVMVFFFAKIFYLQAVQGAVFFARGENNRLRTAPILPNRGVIYDRNGMKLAWNGPESRVYSDLPGLSHILGYVGLPRERDGKILHDLPVGKAGVEREYESVLAGKPGLKLLETDSQNNSVSESVQEAPEDGDDIHLTIDARVQSEFYKAMEKIIRDRGFHGGAGVLLDIKNGGVLALTNYPEYDSGVLSAGGPREKINEFINDKDNPFLNRAVSGVYTPGSIVKPLVAIGALNEGNITPEKKIFSSGSISIPNPYFPDKRSVFYDWKKQGWVDMRQALAHSSNVYFYEVGGGFENIKGLGIKKIKEYAEKFGLGSKTGVDLAGEAKGLVPSPEWKMKRKNDSVWRIGDTYNASIGQGFFQVTPIQMAVFAAAFANDGKILRPHILNPDSQGLTLGTKVRPWESSANLPARYFRVIKEGMRMVVTEGTARGLRNLDIKIAAKSGTAQIGSSKTHVNSWIIGFLPYENPKVAFSIVLEKGPVGNYVGALYAAKELFKWMSANTPEYFDSLQK
ncbi:MAG: hypothetical protein GXP44_02340 [bacterium]|nr:hypothetical protein [bacterium]